MNCFRCGRAKDIEKHHIILRSEGGSDDDNNKKALCLACHDFIHARRLKKSHLNMERRLGDVPRIKVWEHRLEVLNKLNKPKLIRVRGTYIGYWEDDTTHFMPLRGLTVKQANDQAQLELWVEHEGKTFSQCV